MNEINNILFALLRSVLCDEALDKGLISQIDASALDELYKVAKKHEIAQIVGAALEKEGLLNGVDSAEKFNKHQLSAIYHYENQKYELDRISETFEKHQIPFIPLKGSVIRALYPEPWMRISGDIDVLVKKEDHERAKEILMSHLDYADMGVGTEHDVSLFSQGGVHVELHFTLEGIDEITNLSLSRAWEYARAEGGAYRHTLTNEFSIFYCVAHALTHFLLGGCGVRTFCDLYLMRTRLNFDESVVLELCHTAGIEKFYSEMVSLANVWLGHGEKNEISDTLEQFILTGGVFGTPTTRIAVKQSVSGGKSAYIGRRIFVSYDYLKERYPSLKSRAQMPLYQLRRWVDAVRGKRVKRAVAELKISNSLDKSETDGIFDLFSALEITDHTKKR